MGDSSNKYFGAIVLPWAIFLIDFSIKTSFKTLSYLKSNTSKQCQFQQSNIHLSFEFITVLLWMIVLGFRENHKPWALKQSFTTWKWIQNLNEVIYLYIIYIQNQMINSNCYKQSNYQYFCKWFNRIPSLHPSLPSFLPFFLFITTEWGSYYPCSHFTDAITQRR